MPDISKINALAIGSVGKVDGLAKASILDIDGVTVPSAVPAPEAAYSVRLLGSAVGISSYTGDCMRVRRASDSVEADIAFDAGELKLTSGVSNTSDAQSYTDFADFVDHTGTPTDAFVRYWYDQSGNANDAGQSTASAQFKIYDATSGMQERGSVGNEKPALVPLSNSVGFESISVDLTSSDVSSFFVGESNNNFAVAVQFSASDEWLCLAHANNTGPDGAYGGGLVRTSATVYFNGASQVQPVTRGAIHTQFRDTQTLASLVNFSGVDGTTIDIQNIANFFRVFVYQELIFYKSDQSTNRTGIEIDINGFFSIYP